MFAVRMNGRGHRFAGSRTALKLTAVLAGWIALVAMIVSPAAAQSDPGPIPVVRPKISKGIQQTSHPGDVADEDEALPPPTMPRTTRSRARHTPVASPRQADADETEGVRQLSPPSLRARGRATPVVARDPDGESDVEADSDEKRLQKPLLDIVIEGNKTIPTEEIEKKLKSRPGRVVDPQLVREDVQELHRTRWFFTVESRVRQTKKGPVLVIAVVERPILQRIEYKGITAKKELKEIADVTGLKVNAAYDAGLNRELARRIESHYHEKGFIHARVELEKGTSPDEREVVFVIDKGPKVHIDAISFEGNRDIRDGVLKTQLKTKTRFLWLFGGKYDPATIPEDVEALKQYYHGLGYFDVKIEQRESVSKDKARVHVTYQIDEGERYKVRDVKFVGNRVLSSEALQAKLKMTPNAYFSERKLNADVEKITGQYGELGRIFAKIEPVTNWHEHPGSFDLVYQIDEDRPVRFRKTIINIVGEHPHTRETAINNRLRFKPGELASLDKIKKSEQALRNAGIFAGAMPGDPKGPRITVSPVEPPGQKPFQDDLLRVVRGQDLNEDPEPEFGNPILDQNPQFGVPGYPNQVPSWVDPIITVEETQTGRLMVGVGVNSNAGVMGSFVLEENNFDILRPPGSFQDIVDGTAWRGGAQQFRIEAVPGNQLSRYLMSWRDPYFLDQDVSFGVSGFYYTRIFPDWREQRLGGNVTLGRQFSPEWAGAIKVGLGDVKITDPALPVPRALERVLGNNFLSSVRASLAHDTRDSSFLPGKGHYIEAGYEQGFGDFVYPKAELDARQYFTLWERPDGGNRHIVAVVGQIGWTDYDTPIFEKFYAGGFQSFRGFSFYGVTPRERGVRVGGRWQALGSLEYLLPVTADDMIQLVGFTDFGTVESRVTLDSFRVSVGGGLRLTIPAMGPVPLALDLGFPIVKEPFDNTQILSFTVGMLR
jgi:outer membrane protein insertion porin family